MGSFPREHWPNLRDLEGSPFSRDCALIESQRWHDRPTAEVFRFVVDHGDRRATYYWKRHKNDAVRAAAEHQTLARLAEHFAGRDDLGVVEPVALVESDAAVVTAEFAGVELREVAMRGVRLGASAAARQAAIDAVGAAARFIREMQHADPPERREFDLEPLLCWVVDDLGRCLEKGMLEGSMTAQARIALDQTRRRHAGRRSAVVLANSDTKLWNFLIGPGGELRALDFVGTQHDLPTHDFARLWVGLDWLRVFPRSSGAAVDALQQTLLETLSDYRLFDRETFRFHRLCVAVRSAAFATGIRSDPYRRKLRNVVGFPLIRRYYRSLVRRCVTAAVDRAGGYKIPGPDAVARRLERVAASYFPELEGPLEVVERPFVDASTSPIYCYAIRGGESVRQVVVKVAPAFAENNEALTEYNNLLVLAPALERSSAAVAAPRPLDFFADLNAMVTAFVPHQRLSSWLLENNRHWASAETVTRLRQLSRRAGELLAEIHRETAAGETSIGDSELVSSFWSYLELAFEHGLGHASCDAVARLLADLPPSLAGLKVPRALIHGDYGPQNLGISGDDLVVFDLQRNRDAVVFNDIAYYLVTLETINPLPRYPLFSRRRALSLRDDFVEGYFGGEPSLGQQKALHLYYLKHLVQRLHKQGSNVVRSASWLRHQAFVHHSLARAYPAAIERELAALRELVSRGG